MHQRSNSSDTLWRRRRGHKFMLTRQASEAGQKRDIDMEDTGHVIHGRKLELHDFDICLTSPLHHAHSGAATCRTEVSAISSTSPGLDLTGPQDAAGAEHIKRMRSHHEVILAHEVSEDIQLSAVIAKLYQECGIDREAITDTAISDQEDYEDRDATHDFEDAKFESVAKLRSTYEVSRKSCDLAVESDSFRVLTAESRDIRVALRRQVLSADRVSFDKSRFEHVADSSFTRSLTNASVASHRQPVEQLHDCAASSSTTATTTNAQSSSWTRVNKLRSSYDMPRKSTADAQGVVCVEELTTPSEDWRALRALYRQHTLVALSQEGYVLSL